MIEHMTMRSEDLICALKKLGWTQVALARLIGVDTSTINNVIHGRTKSIRLARFIANQIDKNVEDVWPEIYQSKIARLEISQEKIMSP